MILLERTLHCALYMSPLINQEINALPGRNKMNARTQDQDAIEATIQKYVDGTKYNKTDLIRAAFHPQATISTHLGSDFLLIPAVEAIVNHMDSNPPTSETSPDFTSQVVSVDQAGTMATATVKEDALGGLNFTTYFHLHKVYGEWVITAKATYGEPA